MHYCRIIQLQIISHDFYTVLDCIRNPSRTFASLLREALAFSCAVWGDPPSRSRGQSSSTLTLSLSHSSHHVMWSTSTYYNLPYLILPYPTLPSPSSIHIRHDEPRQDLGNILQSHHTFFSLNFFNVDLLNCSSHNILIFIPIPTLIPILLPIFIFILIPILILILIDVFVREGGKGSWSTVYLIIAYDAYIRY